MARDPFNIFIARHEEDAAIAERLRKQIEGGLRNMEHVNLRGPQDAVAGVSDTAFIQHELQQAKFIVLVISVDFINKSENYWELACQLHLDPKSKVRILPILARHCIYTALGLDQMVDTPLFNQDKPLVSWGADDTPYFKFATKLIELINEREKKQTLKARTPREQKKFAQLLSRLNYTEQPNQFLETQVLSQSKFTSNKAFAYLIKGKYGYGQDWLYHILRQKTKDSEIWEEFEDIEDVTYHEIPMSFSSLTLKTNPSIIWTSLGKTLRISSFASSAEVVDHICNKLAKTQIVVFRFENFGELNEEMSRDFMTNFWKAMVKGANAPSDDKARFPIFMFLIDQNHINPVCSSTFLPSNSSHWEPHCGVLLKELDKLSPAVVHKWFYDNRIKINKFDQDLFQIISQPEQLESLIKTILENTEEGIPEMVLGKVSEQFNFRFLEILDQLAENE